LVEKNTQLDTLREIPVKTLDEQKEFISLKYPKKTEKTKFTYKKFFIFIGQMILGMAIFTGYALLFNYFSISFSWLWAIVATLGVTFVINLILGYFHLEQSDIKQFLRW
jgi:hypothetical protein